MPRKQRFKPSRKPKQSNEEVGKATIDQQSRSSTNGGERMPDRERSEVHPDDVETGDLDRVNGSQRDGQD